MRRHYGAVFAYAVAADLISRSPCRGIKPPRVAETRSRLLSPAEVVAIADVMELIDRPIAWLCGGCGNATERDN